MNKHDTLRLRGQALKAVLKKERISFYQVQGICKKVLDNIKFDKYSEAKGIIFEAYISAKIPVPEEVINLEGDDFYIFIGGLLPGREEFE